MCIVHLVSFVCVIQKWFILSHCTHLVVTNSNTSIYIYFFHMGLMLVKDLHSPHIFTILQSFWKRSQSWAEEQILSGGVLHHAKQYKTKSCLRYYFSWNICLEDAFTKPNYGIHPYAITLLSNNPLTSIAGANLWTIMYNVWIPWGYWIIAHLQDYGSIKSMLWKSGYVYITTVFQVIFLI